MCWIIETRYDPLWGIPTNVYWCIEIDENKHKYYYYYYYKLFKTVLLSPSLFLTFVTYVDKFTNRFLAISRIHIIRIHHIVRYIDYLFYDVGKLLMKGVTNDVAEPWRAGEVFQSFIEVYNQTSSSYFFSTRNDNDSRRLFERGMSRATRE